MADAASVIGISGYMRTGKDSVAKLLIDQFGYTKVSFADPLRKMAYDIDPYISLREAPTDVLERFGYHRTVADAAKRYTLLFDTLGYEKAKEIPDFRRYLQRLGTEGVRGNFGDNAWVDLAIKTVKSLPEGTKVVMPDVRFPNEAKAIKDLGGVVWRTERPGFEGGTHPSEAMVAQITPDVTITASSLLNEDGHKGLGTLVLEQLGVTGYDLKAWADSILGASVSV